MVLPLEKVKKGDFTYFLHISRGNLYQDMIRYTKKEALGVIWKSLENIRKNQAITTYKEI